MKLSEGKNKKQKNCPKTQGPKRKAKIQGLEGKKETQAYCSKGRQWLDSDEEREKRQSRRVPESGGGGTKEKKMRDLGDKLCVGAMEKKKSCPQPKGPRLALVRGGKCGGSALLEKT